MLYSCSGLFRVTNGKYAIYLFHYWHSLNFDAQWRRQNTFEVSRRTTYSMRDNNGPLFPILEEGPQAYTLFRGEGQERFSIRLYDFGSLHEGISSYLIHSQLPVFLLLTVLDTKRPVHNSE
jgi:hypothetical protein